MNGAMKELRGQRCGLRCAIRLHRNAGVYMNYEDGACDTSAGAAPGGGLPAWGKVCCGAPRALPGPPNRFR